MKPIHGFLAVVLLVGLTSCSESRQLDECTEVIDACSTVGETRCNADNTTVETCTADLAGCALWTETLDCGFGAFCETTSDGASCNCVNECDEGEAQCAGRTIEVCELDEVGCLTWVEETDCSDTGGGCSDASGSPECVEGCGDECRPLGDEQCNGTRIESCDEDEDGCWLWTEIQDCLESGRNCEEDSSGVSCVDELCEDECDAVGDSRCDDNTVELCVRIPAGCLAWQLGRDCSSDDLFCVVSDGTAECSDTCVSDCDTEDETRCDVNVVQRCAVNSGGCLNWTDERDCEDDDLFCNASSGDAICTDTCESTCDSAGTSRCVGNVVERCSSGPGGCLNWLEETDCEDDGLSCGVGSDGEAFCFCVDSCSAGESQCDGDVVQQCENFSGCWTWRDVADCSELGLPCVETSGDAVCESGSGDDCDDAMVLWDYPAVIEGANFNADFGDDQSFTDDSCQIRPGEPEAIFAVEANAGDTIFMMEYGGIDVAFNVQSACDPDGPCDASVDDFSGGGFYFDVTESGTYYVIIERSYRGGSDYEIVIDIIQPEDCGDGEDNDGDGYIDCDDSDCFGDTDDCGTELNCGDGEDNDDDGETDCDDSDCSSLPACELYQGIYEVFGADQFIDLNGTTITFTPSDSDAMGYTWALSSASAFPVTPGTGTESSELTLPDDGALEYTFSELASFEFYGESYSSMFVSSNGLVSFGSGVGTFHPSVDEFFDQPIIAALWTDINPAAGGTVTVDDFVHQVVITFDGVPRFRTDQPQDVQIVLNSDGSIELHLVTVGPPSNERPTITGISSGTGIEPHPDETDFVTATESCDDDWDNDGDGDIDCDDSDCFGVSPCDTAELNCGDGEDNDDDGDTDCDDADCIGSWACVPYRGYWEMFGPGGDGFDLERRTITYTPDDADPQGYVWVLSPLTGGALPVTPGTGATSTVLTLGDDNSVEHTLTELTTFTFYGIDYSSIFVGSNGYITFGRGDNSNSVDPDAHFATPRIAGIMRDLDPSVRGTVTVDEFADSIVVTFQDVPRWTRPLDPSAGGHDFQFELNGDGSIVVSYMTVSEDEVLVGIADGYGDGTYPDETDFRP